MRKLLFISLILITVACSKRTEKSTSNHKTNDTLQAIETKQISQKSNSNEIDDEVIAVIKEYYKKTYGTNARLETEIKDALLKLTYWYIPSEENYFSDGYIISADIPLTKKSRTKHEKFITNAVEGDLNNDGLDDLAVIVYTEEGNSSGEALFLFINNGKKYTLIGKESESQLNSFFNPGISTLSTLVKIENQLLIVGTYAYSEDDARCCPSLNFEESYALENNQLTLKNKKNIESKENW